MLIAVNVLLHSYIGQRSCKAAKFQIWIKLCFQMSIQYKETKFSFTMCLKVSKKRNQLPNKFWEFYYL